jgi:hypothetical protein
MASVSMEDLRRQLREKFPQAHGLVDEAEAAVEGGTLFDAKMFPVGAVSEVVPAGRNSGMSLLVAGLLENEGLESAGGFRMVLVDGADGFDPGSFSGEACGRLLWVRCRSAMEMVKAADLLVHDGNMPFVLLDAMGLARRELSGVPASAWWRLKQVAERTGCRLVVMSEKPLVPCASVRLVLDAGLRLEDFDSEREELLGRLEVTVGKAKGRRMG